jgi:hypothetical protein
MLLSLPPGEGNWIWDPKQHKQQDFKLNWR